MGKKHGKNNDNTQYKKKGNAHYRLDYRMRKMKLFEGEDGEGEEILEQRFSWLPEDAGSNADTDESCEDDEVIVKDIVLDNDTNWDDVIKTEGLVSDLFFMDKEPTKSSNLCLLKNFKNKSQEYIPFSELKSGSSNSSKGKTNKATFHNDSTSDTDSTAYSNYVNKIAQNRSEKPLAEVFSDTDEGFAELILEYKSLMNSNGSNFTMNSVLDENAAKLLRSRRKQDPRYAQMSKQEFDEIICFDEIYGRREGRGLKARLQQQKILQSASADCPRNDRTNKTKIWGGKINFKQLNRNIKAFLKEDEEETLELDPEPPMIRKLIHELGHIYRLKSESKGQGVERHCIYIKSAHTSFPRDMKRLDRFLDAAQKAVAYAYPENVSDCGTKGKGNKKRTPTTNNPSSAKAKPASGTVIGASAAPIKEDNLGNRLLQKMGWAPGEGLGSNRAGRTDPVAAVFKGNRVGLGLE